MGANKVENKKALLLVIAHNMDAIELVVFLPALCHKGGWAFSYSIIREGQAGVAWFTGRQAPLQSAHRLTHKTKSTLAKLVDAIRTNHNDRYKEICHHHWGDSVLSTKPTVHIFKLEKAKDKELGTELG